MQTDKPLNVIARLKFKLAINPKGRRLPAWTFATAKAAPVLTLNSAGTVRVRARVIQTVNPITDCMSERG
jgi:hypothetical protein